MIKKYSVYLMGVLYIAAGLNHFINPEFYIKMMPFLPKPEWINAISGAAEILLGLAVMAAPLRTYAAIGIIALLVAVFPANIYMLMDWKSWGDSPIPFIVRLPLQGLLIWWAYSFVQKK